MHTHTHTHALQVSFFDSNEVGTLTSRLQSDTQSMTKCVATNLNIAARNMLQAIGKFSCFLGDNLPLATCSKPLVGFLVFVSMCYTKIKATKNCLLILSACVIPKLKLPRTAC
jgi:ABC-type multidrug transport system fused ATPase/permease subunit